MKKLKIPPCAANGKYDTIHTLSEIEGASVPKLVWE